MGMTGLLLLAFCLVGFAAFMLRCRNRVVVRVATSGQQICCPTEFVSVHAMIQPVSSATGPPLWIRPARLRVFRIAFNHSVRLWPLFQTALLLANPETTALVTAG
jgi:hypothetical protein